MANIILVPGIHTAADVGGMPDLGNVLRNYGHNVKIYSYPTRWAMSVYRKKVRNEDAAGLYHICRQTNCDVIISHSNGSLVTQDAYQGGMATSGWISLGGACTSDGVYYDPLNFDWAISVYNPHDTALKIGAKLPFHPFGRMGLKGYRGDPDGNYDDRFYNVNGASSDRWKLNHSHYTSSELFKWAEFCDNNIRNPLSQLSIFRDD